MTLVLRLLLRLWILAFWSSAFPNIIPHLTLVGAAQELADR